MHQRRFPDDLLETQTAWYVTYRDLATAPTASTASLRRRLLRLSQQIAGHHYWQTPAGTPAARVALKEQALALAAETRL
ncbi:hypothetical protein SMD44_p20077 (plasmid) [Streptomyces alboflavus]|uniref:Uncharacterized protein n=1 Tax=Streptomyces alboflavus TaxID=67267 RepID=A0A291W3J0_9ACTN|nr:hypothetical protein [Streptomyces alboflavus]ATM24860.1 hypothetical protein SMD44_p20077 [Streptomyces alboflavus]